MDSVHGGRIDATERRVEAALIGYGTNPLLTRITWFDAAGIQRCRDSITFNAEMHLHLSGL